LVGRVAGRPYYDQDWNFHLGLSGEYVIHPNINASGTAGVNRTTLIFQDRPELRIDMNRLISTGNLSSSSANVYGGEAAIGWRNLLVQGEYYQIGDTQSKLPGVPSPDRSFNGGYVEVGWNITGEPFHYSVGNAAFARPKVDRPFTIDERGIGAWQLAARYSLTNLNSNVLTGVSQNVTGGVFGGDQKIFGAALSWYPNDWVRLELQYQLVDVNKLNTAGTVQIGQRYSTLAGRVQVAW
jgi:phosphate-selective porin OprO/OprP